MTYVPRPIDTSAVALPAWVDWVADRLARHIHDVWALRRIEEGWRYGSQRNDVLKTHPDLVSYEALPDSEKAYDRETSLGAIRVLLAMGCEIRPPAGLDTASRQENHPLHGT